MSRRATASPKATTTATYDLNEELRNPNILPPLNLHVTTMKVCSTCKHGTWDDGSFVCRRPFGPIWDAGDREEERHVCNRWGKRD